MTPGERIYAVGDIHGRHDLLVKLIELIRSEINEADHLRCSVVFLGDYVDRGPDSAKVLDTLMLFQQTTPSRFLKGNHEALLLEFVRNPASLTQWATVGGVQTLTSYGLSPPLRPSDNAIVDQHAAFLAALPQEHLAFIGALEAFHISGDYFFVHAGVRPRRLLSRQVEDDLLWIRDDFLLHPLPFEKRIVHGHTPVKDPDLRENRINIDTGAYVTGRLTAAVLEGTDVRFIQASRDS